jgi:hypothetical protein
MQEALRNAAFLPEEAQCGGSLGRAPLLETLKNMLRKAPDMGISLHGDPFMSEGNLESGGRSRIPGTLNDEGRRALEGGFSLEGSFTWNPERYVKEIHQERCKNALKPVSLSIWAPLRNVESIRLPGLFEKKG